MCFHGRSNSLVAGDSVTGLGVISAADETEPDVMEIPANRNRKGFLSVVLIGRLAGNESYQAVFPLVVWRCVKQNALQEPEFLNIMLCSAAVWRGAHSG
jgi:hypothetical protein